MANRHLSRSVVLQTLFEWDFMQKTSAEAEMILERDAEEFAPGVDDITFMKRLLKSVLAKHTDLDLIIAKAAPDWPLEKISVIDRNVLRIGLCELLFSDKKEVPAKVAINEAIELAKTFGGETSGRFVNGVLGAVYKEMGEPGKDDEGLKKKRPKEVPFEQMEIQKLGGAVAYAVAEGNVYLELMHDVFGHWTLSKGGVKEGETEEQCVTRALKEEIGIDIKVEDKLGMNEYVANHPEKGKYRKQVTYFLAKADYIPLQLEEKGGLDKAEWFKIQDIVDLNFYDDITPIITKAVGLLLQAYPTKESMTA